MGKFYRKIEPDLREFILGQKIFFVATAARDGSRINLSPKGYDSLAILDDSTLAYYDLPGSGNETANHLAQDGRITLMWCSFAKKALILRAYCYGETIGRESDQFVSLMNDQFPGANRAIVRQAFACRVEALQTSCGYGVPSLKYDGDRDLLTEWAETKLRQGKLEEYNEANAVRNDAKFPVQPRLKV